MDYEKGLWFFENQNNFTSAVRRKDTSFDAVTNGLLVHTSDLNGDGWPEMIVGTLTPTKLSIQVSKGTGPFEFDALQEIGFVQGGTSDFAPTGRAVTRLLHTIDINDDGKKDIVMTSTFDKKQVAWINNSIISSNRDELLTEVSVFPNPVADFLFYTSDLSVTYTIFNMSGDLCLKGELQTNDPLDISTLCPGSYFLVTMDEKGTKKPQKFIKR